MTRFDYNPQQLDSGIFKISPSSLFEFTNKTHNWFASNFQNQYLFQPNTGSITGAVVHECLDCIVKGEPLPESSEVLSFANSIQTEDEYYSVIEVMSNWERMVDLGRQYIDTQEFIKSEGWCELSLSPNVSIAGTYDGLVKTNDRTYIDGFPPVFVKQLLTEPLTIIDYKTTAGGLPPKKMERKHQWQLLCYAYVLRKQGFNVTHIEVPYISRYKPGKVSEKTGKTGKDYPSHLTVITRTITQYDLDFIESIINLTQETVEYFFTHPELANILFKDQRLKSQNFTRLVKPYQPKVEEEF